MKRMLFAAFAMLLCLGLAACGTDASPPSGESLVPPPSGPVEPLEIRQVSVEPPEMDSVWEIPGTARLSLLQECCPVGTERLTLVEEVRWSLGMELPLTVRSMWMDGGRAYREGTFPR